MIDIIINIIDYDNNMIIIINLILIGFLIIMIIIMSIISNIDITIHIIIYHYTPYLDFTNV